MKKAVVLVSGGIDSSTILAIVANQGFAIYALSFNYAQRHLIELEKVKKIISELNSRVSNSIENDKINNLDPTKNSNIDSKVSNTDSVYTSSANTNSVDVNYGNYSKISYYNTRYNNSSSSCISVIKDHKIIKLDFSVFAQSSCLLEKNLSVPKYKKANDLGNNIPITYVPARNTIFLSYALGWAESIGANDIFMGVHMEDCANYPDCTPQYLKSFQNMANLGTKSGKISISAPLIKMSKADIVAAGLKLGVNYSNTISCYDPTLDGKSCGYCHACLIRIKAFETNNIQDPIAYV